MTESGYHSASEPRYSKSQFLRRKQLVFNICRKEGIKLYYQFALKHEMQKCYTTFGLFFTSESNSWIYIGKFKLENFASGGLRDLHSLIIYWFSKESKDQWFSIFFYSNAPYCPQQYLTFFFFFLLINLQNVLEPGITRITN